MLSVSNYSGFEFTNMDNMFIMNLVTKILDMVTWYGDCSLPISKTTAPTTTIKAETYVGLIFIKRSSYPFISM